MAAILIPGTKPSYVALSTDISGSMIDGVSIIGATVYLTDTEVWKVVDADLKLVDLSEGNVDIVSNVQPVGLGLAGSGELQGSGSVLQMPTLACKYVKFKARGDNAGYVYIGGSAVTIPNGTTDITTGFELASGEETGWLPATNVNLFYRICNNAGDDLTYIALV